MPDISCPQCKQPIPEADFNVATDIAYCRACQETHSFAELAHQNVLDVEGMDDVVPRGAWEKSDFDEVRLGASHRNIPAAIGLLFFATFWNGITSIFVLVNIASTMNLLGITLPVWFPAPEMNDSEMGWGMTLFLWIFLTPFILVGIGTFIGAIMSIVGHTEVKLTRNEGIIYSGIGPIGRKRRFELADVKQIKLDNKKWKDSDGDSHQKESILIELKDGRDLKFASGLPKKRKHFIARKLKQLLA